jgi:hypothetical protein
MTIAILVAPATRIGYLLYPVDFFIFSWLLRSEDLGSPMRAWEEPALPAVSDDAATAIGPVPVPPGDEPFRRLSVPRTS